VWNSLIYYKIHEPCFCFSKSNLLGAERHVEYNYPDVFSARIGTTQLQQSKETIMAQSTHTDAAKIHEDAAKAHHEAAMLHGKSDAKSAMECSQKAHSLSEDAHKLSKQASGSAARSA